jgi:hypothetical protein
VQVPAKFKAHHQIPEAESLNKISVQPNPMGPHHSQRPSWVCQGTCTHSHKERHTDMSTTSLCSKDKRIWPPTLRRSLLAPISLAARSRAARSSTTSDAAPSLVSAFALRMSIDQAALRQAARLKPRAALRISLLCRTSAVDRKG